MIPNSFPLDISMPSGRQPLQWPQTTPALPRTHTLPHLIRDGLCDQQVTADVMVCHVEIRLKHGSFYLGFSFSLGSFTLRGSRPKERTIQQGTTVSGQQPAGLSITV